MAYDSQTSLELNRLRGARKSEAQERLVREVRAGKTNDARGTDTLLSMLSADEAQDPDTGIQADKRQGQFDAALDFFRPDVSAQRHDVENTKLKLAVEPQKAIAEGRLAEQDLANQGALDKQALANQGMLAAVRAKGNAQGGLPQGIQQRVADSNAAIELLQRLGPQFEKGMGGPVEGRVNYLRQVIPGIPEPDDEYNRFTADVATLRNAVTKALAGAQVSKQEEERMLAQLPTENDKPGHAGGKVKASIDNLHYIIDGLTSGRIRPRLSSDEMQIQ